MPDPIDAFEPDDPDDYDDDWADIPPEEWPNEETEERYEHRNMDA